MEKQILSKEFLKMQKLAGLITESQFKQLTELKQGDKFKGGFVLASNDDNDIPDTEFQELLKLSKDKGVTKDNFVVISTINDERVRIDGDYSGKQLVYLIKNKPEIYQIKNPSLVNEVRTSYRKGDDIFDIIDADVLQPDIEKYSSKSSELFDEPGIDRYKGGVGFKTGRQKDRNGNFTYTEEQKENYLKYLKKKVDEGNEVAQELFKIAKKLPEVQYLVKRLNLN